MSSDDVKPRGDVRFRPAGTGLPYTVRCAKCNQPTRMHGSRWQMLGGVKQRFGRCCAKTSPERAA